MTVSKPITGRDVWLAHRALDDSSTPEAVAEFRAFQRRLSDERAAHERSTRFVLTADHVALLGAVYVNWSYCETGAPEIDPKRPYGDSSVADNVAEILGWPLPDDPDEDTDPDEARAAWAALEARALTLHRQTAVALHVVLCARSFEPGTYVRSNDWSHDWRREVAGVGAGDRAADSRSTSDETPENAERVNGIEPSTFSLGSSLPAPDEPANVGFRSASDPDAAATPQQIPADPTSSRGSRRGNGGCA